MTTTNTHTLNDVNLSAVGALIEAIKAEPEKADTTWRAEVNWTGGFRSEASIREFGASGSDEPAGLGGTDTAPNPVEQLLAALGNCLAVGYAANASAADIAIHDLKIEVEGELDLHTFLGQREGNAGFESIRATVHLVTDASEDEVAALHAKVNATSPVGHTLARAVPLSVIPG